MTEWQDHHSPFEQLWANPLRAHTLRRHWADSARCVVRPARGACHWHWPQRHLVLTRTTNRLLGTVLLQDEKIAQDWCRLASVTVPRLGGGTTCDEDAHAISRYIEARFPSPRLSISAWAPALAACRTCRLAAYVTGGAAHRCWAGAIGAAGERNACWHGQVGIDACEKALAMYPETQRSFQRCHTFARSRLLSDLAFDGESTQAFGILLETPSSIPARSCDNYAIGHLG